MKKLMLIGVSCMLLNINQVNAANWVLTGKSVDGNETFYIDTESIMTSRSAKNDLWFWIRNDLLNPINVGFSHQPKWSYSTVTRHHIQCDQKIDLIISWTYYDKQGLVLSAKNWPDNSDNWRSIPPETLLAGAADLVCQAKGLQ